MGQSCGVVIDMNGRPTPIGVSVVRHAKHRRKRGIVLTGGQVPLSAKELKQHARLLKAGKPMSGKSGPYVYYIRKGKQRWRRAVPNRDPRTFAQLRSRTVFGAASRTWSHGGPLTEEQRDAWLAEGGKVQSRPRLGQSGKLTGQQHFIGHNSTKKSWTSSLLLDPHQQNSKYPQLAKHQPLTDDPPARRPVNRRHPRKTKRKSLIAQLA
jgi:hypothetical protein